MNGDLIYLVLDVAILAFLIATIFYVIRLSKGLSEFKAHRREFNGVITSLLSSIDQAERSINSLKQVSVQEAAELERLIKQSKLMFEDLQIINEAGENMAKRLEKLAEKNREIAQKSHSHIGGEMGGKISSKVPYKSKKQAKKNYTETLEIVEKSDADLPSFMIQDREFSNIDSLDDPISNDIIGDMGDDYQSDKLQSQAEKELFAALRSNKSKNVKRGNLK